MQYRFGVLGRIELAYPSQHAGSLTRFSGAHRFHPLASVSAYFLMFEVAGARYVVTEMEGGDGFVGVQVEGEDARAVEFRCDSRGAVSKGLHQAVGLVPEGIP